MRRLIPLILLMLTSCVSYTIQDGYDAIVLPDVSEEKIETRYRVIEAEKAEIDSLNQDMYE